MSTRVIVWAVPALLYILFFVWYTDLGGPLKKGSETKAQSPDIGRIRVRYCAPKCDPALDRAAGL